MTHELARIVFQLRLFTIGAEADISAAAAAASDGDAGVSSFSVSSVRK